METNSDTRTPICIVGAGPAGSTTALFLNKQGMPCILLDRAVFPRDKTCGESYDGRVTHTLKKLDPGLLKKLGSHVLECRKYTLVNSQSRRVEIKFPPSATPRLLGRRIDFDNFLIQEVRKSQHIHFLENTTIEDLSRGPDGWKLLTGKGEQIDCKLLILATGANSVLSSKLGIVKHRPEGEYLFAKGYYRNIAKLDAETTVEIFFVKKPVPLCFSLCPVCDGLTNVQIGLNRLKAQKHRLNVRTLLPEVIKNHPELSERFRNASLQGSIKGARMVLPNAWPSYSGEGFLRVGDSASSINPVTGYGVGHAMAQGRLAAQIAKISLEKDNVSAAFLKQYDHQVKEVIGKEIMLGRVFTALSGFIPLLDFLISLQGFQRFMRHILSDSNFAKKIMRPFSRR